MIVVDSSVWIGQLRGVRSTEVRLLQEIRAANEIIVGDLVALEVVRGARSEREAVFLESGFRRHGLVRMLDEALAFSAASHYHLLRSLGITISKTVDLVIATFCIANGHELLHSDRDFDAFEEHLGLRVYR